MAGITFDPYGPTTGCVDIVINRDLLVEYLENFTVHVDMDQADDSVIAGVPSYATVEITDEERGEIFRVLLSEPLDLFLQTYQS